MAKNVAEENRTMAAGFNPFPGLRPFTPDESDLFFGREGQSEEIMAKLNANRFVTVIGASGSGKSSLIYCGIIPRLIKSSSAGWRVITIRPGNDPLGNLIDRFAEEIGEKENSGTRVKLESAFRSSEPDLDPAIKMLNPGKGEKILLMIDQFEELFRFKESQRSDSFVSDSRIFVNLIVNAVNRSSGTVNVIITMRSDFIGECAHFQGLTALINNSNYLVPHMARENYLKAITGPIEYAGARIEEELVNSILNEIGNRTDQLPVLQHAMMRTWSHWLRLGKKDIPVSKADYDSVGQMGEAMSRHADEAFEELDERGREICEVLFKTITEKGSDNKGTRHPTRVDTIASIARCSHEELYRVVDTFRHSGRSFLTPAPGVELSAESVIDLSHESLMRVWDRLSRWVDEEAASVQMYMRLSEASALFHEGKTTLWRPPDLQLAINWRNDNRPTLTWAERYNPAFERAMVYLETSEKEYLAEEENKIKAQKRQLRRSRITAMILGTAAIISVFFMLYAFVKQVEAERNRKEADLATIEAQKQEAEALRQKDSADVNSQRAIAASILAQQNQETAEYNAAVADTQRLLALNNAERARLQEAEAKRQAGIATENEQRARENAELARIEEERATRLRMVSIGKTMAIKSMQVSGQSDLQGLLAYQAYIFNKRNGGAPNDADIYMGLYSFARIFGGAGYKTLQGHQGAVRSVEFSPGKNTLYSAGSDGKVFSWDLTTGEKKTIYEGNERIEVIATSNDGKWVATGSDNPVIKVIPVSGSGVTYTLSGHTGIIKSLIFSADNRFLYSSSRDGKLLKWNLQERTSQPMNTEGGVIVSLDISGTGELIAGATERGRVYIWKVADNSLVRTIESTNGIVYVVKFDGKGTLAIGFQNGRVELWDIGTGTLKSDIKVHDARVNDIGFNNAFSQMATASSDRTVKIWNLEDLTEPPIELSDNGGYVLTISFSADGRLVVSGSEADMSNDNLLVRPTRIDYMVGDICSILTRNFTEDEWRIYVGEDIDYEETCSKKELSIKVEEKKGD